MKRFGWIGWLAFVVWLLAACAHEVEPGATPADPVLETPVIGIPGSGETPVPDNPAEAARMALAVGLGISVDEIQVVSQEPVEWPNACLGLELPGIACADVIVPGARVTLAASEQQYVFHTGAPGDRPVFAGPADEQSGDNLILVWERVGGIAGFCDHVRVFQGGWVQTLGCEGGSAQPMSIRIMDPVEQEQLRMWVEEYGEFTIERRDPAQADAMTIRLAFQGAGEGQPDEAVQDQMLEFVQILQTNLFPPQP